MTIYLANTVRDAMNDAWETAIGTSPIMRLYGGAVPTALATSPGTVLAEGTLPSDWMAASSSGAKAKSGSWTLTGQAGAGAGTNATFYRIYNSGGTVMEQGSVTATGGGGDATMDNVSVANTQTITVNTFTRTASNPPS